MMPISVTIAWGLVPLSFLLAAALVAVPQRRGIPKSNLRIVGGSDAPDGMYPYQVSVGLGDSAHICGGSIIDHYWILTAAHCVTPYQASALTVNVGSNQWSSGGKTYDVVEIFCHENYNSGNKQNDVAVLKVDGIYYSNKIQPIVLDTEEIGDKVACILTGWGRRWYPDGPAPKNLQHLKLQTTTADLCKKKYPRRIFEGSICTLTKSGEGACKGDSGGPLVRKVNGVFKQIGIISYGKECARGVPDVYARVSNYIPWIKAKCNCI